MAKLRSISTILSSRNRRRTIPATVAACLLGACSSEGGGDWSPLYEIAKNAWTGESEKVTLEEAAAVPYASMGISLGGGPQVMMLLIGDTDGQQLWISGAKIAITTKYGRIVRTAGIEHDLGGYESRGGTGDNLRSTVAQTVRWQADFPDLRLYSVSIVCQDKPAGEETITILGKDIHTLRVEETCASESSRLDWSFDNTYWVDTQDALVWRSIQHVHPKLDKIEIEILRPPG